jgi:hypothetical protein
VPHGRFEDRFVGFIFDTVSKRDVHGVPEDQLRCT